MTATRTSPNATAWTSPASASVRSSLTSTRRPNRSVPGAKSSRAPPARCSARPAPAEPGPPGRQTPLRAGFLDRVEQPLGGLFRAHSDPYVARLAQGIAGGHGHAGLRQPGPQRGARELLMGRPDEVRLAFGDFEAPGPQLGHQAGPLLPDRLDPLL